jgi:hypothetical protein
MSELANLYQAKGRYDLNTLSLSLSIFSLIVSHLFTVVFFFSLCSYQESEELFLDLLKLKQDTCGPENPLTFNTINSLACLYDVWGKFTEADKCHQDCIILRKKVQET